MARKLISSGAKRRVATVWTLRTPTTVSFQVSGTESIEVSPARSNPRRYLKRGSSRTSGTSIGRRAAAAAPVMPSPSARLTRLTWSRSRPFVAARVRRPVAWSSR